MFAPTARQERALDGAIAETIAHAARAPHYKKSFGRTQVKGRADLERLPLLDKETAASRQEALVVPGVRAGDAATSAGIVSSATTRQGRPLRVLRSPDEGPRARLGQAEEPLPVRTLEIYSPRHGHREGNDPSRVLLPATLHPNTVDVVADLLSARPPRGVPRLGVMVAPVSTLKWLSVALVERGTDPSTLGVREIGTTGYPLTAHARAWLSGVWAADLYDNYSLSEIPGYALECETCGFHHWEGCAVVPELIDPTTGKPTTTSRGELVLTTLVPDVLRMPLIRYRTGDVVEKGPVCPDEGRRGIRFLGRLSQSLVERGKKGAVYAVLSRDLLEVGEALPDIALHPHASEVLGRVPPSDLGVPKLVVDVERRAVVAELRYDPDRYPARAAQVAVLLRERVVAREAKGVTLDLRRPGSLDVSRMALKL